MNHGSLFVIEGTDGSGKTVQTKLLAKRLIDEDFDVSTWSFPRYGTPGAYFVEKYLNGEYGMQAHVGPYAAACFFAMDRYEAGALLKRELTEQKIVICNRYVASNMAHQGQSFQGDEGLPNVKRTSFFNWLYDFEHNILGLPEANLNVVLHVPVHIAQQMVDEKKERGYLKEGKRDLHEADLDHLKRAEAVYLSICREFRQTFSLVECYVNDTLLSPEAIHEQVWKIIEPRVRRD